MTKHLVSVLALSAAICGSAAASAARSADRDICADYSRAAVRQFREAQEHPRCHGFIRHDPNRWHGNFRAHFEWCRASPWGAVRRERNLRRDALRECAHGW